MNASELGERGPGVPLERRRADSIVPLTPIQQVDWIQMRREGSMLSPFRIAAVCERVRGPLNVGALCRSLEDVVARHEPLRTRIVCLNDEPVQQIDPAGGRAFAQTIVADEQELRNLAANFTGRCIDLAVGPLFDARIFSLSDSDHVLLVALDHFVCDRTSCSILRRDIWATYRSLIGKGAAPSAPSLQFADYAVWQGAIHHAWMRTHGAYWRRRLSGARALRFPEESGEALEYPTARLKKFRCGPALSHELRRLAWQSRVLLPVLASALYCLSMRTFCGQEDMVLPFVMHGRNGPKLADMIGSLAAPIFLRVEVAADEPFSHFLRRLNIDIAEANGHQDYGRLQLMYPECSLATFLNWFPSDQAQAVPHAPELVTQRYDLSRHSLRVPDFFRIGVGFRDTREDIELDVWYRPDLFREATVIRFAESMTSLAAAFVESPESKILRAP